MNDYGKKIEFLDWEFGVFFHFGIRSFFPGHKDWDGKVEYWNFFADCWVTPGAFNADCMTSSWTAEDFVKGNGGEVVKLKVSAAEVE